jgi:hypothetical protein
MGSALRIVVPVTCWSAALATACAHRIHPQEFIMLELRPTCEHCNTPLPPDSTEAMICSFECTFCRSCVEQVLHNVCPNCGGGFCVRPHRPHANLKNGNNLEGYPASTRVVYKPVDVVVHREFAAGIATLAPHRR